jgi:hypothetical protein
MEKKPAGKKLESGFFTDRKFRGLSNKTAFIFLLKKDRTIYYQAEDLV